MKEKKNSKWKDPVWVSEYNKKYKKLHYDEIKEQQNIYRTSIRPEFLRRKRESWERNKLKDLAKKKIHYEENKSEILQKQKEHYNEIKGPLRLEVLTHYSNGDPICKCCSLSMFEFLTMDHIHGGNRGKNRKTGINLIKFLKGNNYPKGFQVLCFNCNCSKGHFGECGHKFKWEANSKIRRWKLKLLQIYSKSDIPFCKCCKENNMAFLTLDHISGREDHEKASKRDHALTASNLYLYLKKLSFPHGYQVLCYNCNCAKGNGAKCPHESNS